MKGKVNTAVFTLALAALFFGFWLSPKRVYSDNENRYLAGRPALTLQSLFAGDFTRGFEDWVTDGFPLRDRWIALKSRLDLLAGRRDTGGVYVTKEGRMMEVFDEVDEARYEKNLDYLRQAKALYAELDRFDVMLIPTASHVLREQVGLPTPDVDQASLLERASDLLTYDALSALEAHRDEYIYYYTDHHWTSLGAWYVYALRDDALAQDAFVQEVLTEDFLGTTFSRAGIYEKKDAITAFAYGSPTVEHNRSGAVTEGLYDRSYLSKKDKYSVFLGGNQALTVIRTGQEGGKLLLVKDSYANTYVQFLIPHYAEIHVVDLRSFAGSLRAYAREAGITEMTVLYNLKGFSEETSLFRIVG
ncbi:MAG: hypothetical protein E7423_02690 [Ruminococcaceae bacterium]|nr:hypothetical protein [Oscillospiraceae bacterium]